MAEPISFTVAASVGAALIGGLGVLWRQILVLQKKLGEEQDKHIDTHKAASLKAEELNILALKDHQYKEQLKETIDEILKKLDDIDEKIG